MADQDLMSARSQESGRSGRLQTLRIRVSSVGHVLLKYAASLRPTAAWFSHGQPQPAPRERALKAAIVQDDGSGRVLMLAWMNEEALRRTRESGQAWFWSRSRAELWHKGATSGSFLNVEELHEDCDGDAILLKVRAKGPACHTGAESCFAPWLWRRVAERAKKRPEGSYVVSLLENGAGCRCALGGRGGRRGGTGGRIGKRPAPGRRGRRSLVPQLRPAGLARARSGAGRGRAEEADSLR